MPIRLLAIRHSLIFSRRPYQPRLGVEHGGRKAVAVGHELAKERQRRRMRRLTLLLDGAEIEAQLGLELARELLHARIARKARHVHELDAAIARRQQRALEQRRADAVALPRRLHSD